MRIAGHADRTGCTTRGCNRCAGPCQPWARPAEPLLAAGDTSRLPDAAAESDGHQVSPTSWPGCAARRRRPSVRSCSCSPGQRAAGGLLPAYEIRAAPGPAGRRDAGLLAVAIDRGLVPASAYSCRDRHRADQLTPRHRACGWVATCTRAGIPDDAVADPLAAWQSQSRSTGRSVRCRACSPGPHCWATSSHKKGGKKGPTRVYSSRGAARSWTARPGR